LFNSGLDDECRDVIFKEPVANKAMKNHVIRSEEAPSEGSCLLMCYGTQLCVHQFSTIGERKTQMRVEERYR